MRADGTVPARPIVDRMAALLASCLPGVIAGVQLVALSFFLNPALAFGPGPFLRGALAYGGALGALSCLLTAAFTRADSARTWRALPWAITAALLASGLWFGAHASRLAFSLPPGINSRLVKAAVWLAGVGLIYFYTALLHSLHRRRYGWRSRIGLALALVIASYTSFERREAFVPRSAEPLRPLVRAATAAPHLLLVGIDGATLDVLLPLAGRGKLPFMASMLRRGSYGRLTSPPPTETVAVWTSVATGRFPHRHGVVGPLTWPAAQLGDGARLSLLPGWVGFADWGVSGQPSVVDAGARQGLAVWDILARQGLSVGVVGWPLTSPPAADPALVVADLLFTAAQPVAWPADLAARLARPPERATQARLLAPSPEELAPLLASRFEASREPRLLAALAGDSWRAAVAGRLFSQQGPQVRIVVLDGLAAVEEATFGGFHATQFDGSRNFAAMAATAELASYYGFLDETIAGLWAAVPEPRLLVLVSASGARRLPLAGLRGTLRGRPLTAGSLDGGPDGLLLLLGDGVRSDALLTGARLVDVLPTILYGLGFPSARDLDGRALTTAFDASVLTARPLAFVPSYEGLPPRRP